MPNAGPRQVVVAYTENVLNGRDPSQLDRLIANQALALRVASFRRAFPDLRVTVREITSEGELVAVHLTGRATHRGIFQGIPATNREWTASCTAMYRVRDGQIVDFWLNWDVLGILEQIGGIARLMPASA
jgi:predicted ester cyclase